MISSEVQRTLVKSPPELWAEISDPASLARHFGEFGEISITRVEPEQRVEWQAGDTSGSVIIKPSGWGTKVKLSVTRERAASQAEADGDAREARGADGHVTAGDYEPAPPADDEPGVVDDDEAAMRDDAPGVLDAAPALPEPRPEPELPNEAERAPAGEAAAVPVLAEPSTESRPIGQPAPAPRRGFFARLFGRRRSPMVEPAAAHQPAPQVAPAERPAPAPYNALAVWASQMNLVDGVGAQLTGERACEATAETADADTPAAGTAPTGAAAGEGLAAAQVAAEQGAAELVAAEQAATEEAAAERVTELLTGVLDRLGAAHHRPFSRA